MVLYQIGNHSVIYIQGREMAYSIWRCMFGEALNGIVPAVGIFSICRCCDHTCLLRQDFGKLPAHTDEVRLRSDSSCERMICPRLDHSDVRACSEDDGSESGDRVGEGQV